MKPNEAAQYALEASLKAGAGKAACRVSQGRKDEFNVEANKFTLLRTLFSDQLSIKIIKDGRKGVMSLNKLDKDSINEAVANCMALTSSALPDEAEDIAEKQGNKNFDQSIKENAGMDGLFNRTREFIEQAKDEYPKIILEGVTAEFNSGDVTYVNSNGVEFNRRSESYNFGTMFSAKDGEASSSFNGYDASLASLDRAFIDLDMHRTLLSESEKSIHTKMIDSKFVGPVIVSPACTDMIWGTIIGCFLSDAALIEGTSRWKDSLGSKVADAKLCMGSSPLNKGIVGGERFTADGYESKDFYFIQDGILKSFALSLYGANKTSKPRAANTAFYNFDVAAGDTSLEDMIKGIDKGILLNRFSGASPGPSGDISGVAKNSFLIENGKVTDALKETMVSFNIVDALMNIRAISKERCFNGSTILPWCCFEGITIS